MVKEEEWYKAYLKIQEQQKRALHEIAKIQKHLDESERIYNYVVDLSRVIAHRYPEWELEPLPRKKLRNEQ